MKAFIIFSLLFVLCSFVAIGQTKATIVEINTTTLWGVVKFSKNNYKEMDIRQLSPSLVKFSPKARRALNSSSRLIRRIERTYR